MGKFKDFIEAAMTMNSRGAGVIPPSENHGDNDDNEGYQDWDELPRLIKAWMRRKDAYYQAIVDEIISVLFNKEDGYKQDRLYFVDTYPSPRRDAKSDFSPNGKVEYKWDLRHDSPEFAAMKERIQAILMQCSSLWRDIKLKDSWGLSRDVYFFNKFLNVFLHVLQPEIQKEAQISGVKLYKNQKVKYGQYYDTVDKILLSEFKRRYEAEQPGIHNYKILKMSVYGFVGITSYDSINASTWIELKLGVSDV